MNRTKKIMIILVILTIVFTFFGSTLAYLNWQTSESQKTNIVFKLEQDFWCAADGGGDITEEDAFVVPTTCTNSTHAIQREVVVIPTIHRNGLSITTELFLDIDSIDSGLSNSDNFKYALTTNANSCTEGVISSATFKGKQTGDQVRILSQNYSNSAAQTYYLYVWLDAAETSTTTMDQSFNLSISGDCFDVVEPESPIIDEGMIPVTLASDGTVTTIQPGDPDWYDYENKEWANVVLVDDESRSTYQDTSGVIVNQSDILAYYVWVPRYSYRIPQTQCSAISNVNMHEFPGCYSYVISGEDKASMITWLYEGLSEVVTDYTLEQATAEVEKGLQTGIFNSSVGLSMTMYEFILGYNDATGSSVSYTVEYSPTNKTSFQTEIDIEFEATKATMQMGDAIKTYRTHPAFWWDDNENGIVDSGETVAGIWVGKFETTGTGNAPTILPNTSSLRGQNISEQFITSLKFSVDNFDYGLDKENTNSHMMKNSEWGAVAYLSHSKYGINGDIRTNNNSEYITGCGALYESSASTTECQISYNSESTPQSTTGNITGVFDMSGGAHEYVMGIFDSDMTVSKYYDLYTSERYDVACNGGICYGHALSETPHWHYWADDYSGNILDTYFVRGGYYNSIDPGIFMAYHSDGNANEGFSWRSVIVVGYSAELD